MNVLVMGGAGFIGWNLVEHHLERGDEMQLMDDLSTGAAAKKFTRQALYSFKGS